MTGKDGDPEDRTEADEPCGPTHFERPSTPRAQKRSALAPGNVLADRYRIVRLIAHGGMGEVYEAEDLELRSSVALKTIRAELATEAMIERFRREVYLARQITHPNVCRLFDLGRHGDVVFLTMELLAGETLSRLLKRIDRLELADALPIAAQIASAIDAAHAAGIVHRDLKPGNVMLVPRGEPRAIVTDFGVAYGGADPFGDASGAGEIVGSPAYMAPEQLRGGGAAPAADIYSFGVVIYEMVTGVRPFGGDSSLEAAFQRLTGDPDPPRRHVPALPPAAEAAILRCLARDPAARFPTAQDAVRALAAEPAPRSRPLWQLLVAGAVACAAAGAITWWLARPGAASAPRDPRLAVVGLTNLSGRADTRWLATALAETISIDLTTGGRVRAISGEQVARAKADLALHDAESYAPETLAKLRGRLGVDVIVVGSYLALGGERGDALRVNIRVQDARTGDSLVEVSETATVAQLAVLARRVDDTIRDRLGLANGSAANASALVASIPASPEALRLYSEGLVRLRLFDAAGARDRLTQAVALDPERPTIHAALSDAWKQLGYDAKALDESKRASELARDLPLAERRMIEATYHEAAQEWDRAIAIYRELPADLETGLRLAAAQIAAGRSNDAAATIAGLRALRVDDPRIELADADAAEWNGDFAREQRASERALALAEQLGARRAIGLAQLAIGRSYDFRGQLASSAEHFEKARGVFAAIGDRANEARSQYDLEVVDRDLGENARAEQRAEQVTALLRETGSQRGTLGAVLDDLALMAIEHGDLARAEKLGLEALAIARETASANDEASDLSLLAELHRAEGSPAAALRSLESAVAANPKDNDTGESWLDWERGLVLADMGDVAATRAALEHGIAIARKHGALGDLANMLDLLASAMIEAGDLAGARTALDEAATHQRATGHLAGLAKTDAIRAELARAEGQFDAAARLADTAAATLDRMRLVFDELDALVTLARADIARGKPDQARAVAVRAAALGLQGRKASLAVALVGAEVDAAAHRGTPAIVFARVRNDAAAAQLGRLERAARADLDRTR